MRVPILIVTGCILTFGWMKTSVAVDEVLNECPSRQFIEGIKDYSERVCAGDSFFQGQAFSRAMVEYENALAMPLHETPNFELLPQLALTYLKLGKLERAQKIMDESELSLQIFIGGAKCIETEVSYDIDGPSIKWFSRETRKSVSLRMCGAAYDSLYAQGTFQHTLIAAELIKKHKEVAEQVGISSR